MNTITVRYFAATREAIGCDAETIHTAAATIGALRAELATRSAAHAAALAPERALRMALDQDMCDDPAATLHDGAEVAFFPPVTGG